MKSKKRYAKSPKQEYSLAEINIRKKIADPRRGIKRHKKMAKVRRVLMEEKS